MANEANGKVALVTGASSGIGAAIAERLGAEGFAVVVNYVGHRQGADEVVRKVAAIGGRATAIGADVTKADEVKRLFDEAEATYKGLDVLINNAGRAIRKPLAEFADADFESVIKTNLYGSFYCLREAARRLRDGGRVVNISMSFQGPPIPGYGVYFASKAAIEEMTRVAAKELGSRKITVNALRPDPTRTKLFMDGKPPEVVHHFEQEVALGRLGEPEDTAEVVSFLAGPRGGWINGQAFAANGGYW